MEQAKISAYNYEYMAPYNTGRPLTSAHKALLSLNGISTLEAEVETHDETGYLEDHSISILK